jgi:hypothetical protein
MRIFLTFSALLVLTACADQPRRPTQDMAKRTLSDRCPAGYVEYPQGSGFCEPYEPARRQPMRDTLGSTLSQPLPTAPALGGLRR